MYCVRCAIRTGQLAVEFTGSKSNRDPRYGLILIATLAMRRIAASIGHDNLLWPSGNPLTRVICRNLPRQCRKHFGASFCDAMPGDFFLWGVCVDQLVLHRHYKGSKSRGYPQWRRRHLSASSYNVGSSVGTVFTERLFSLSVSSAANIS